MTFVTLEIEGEKSEEKVTECHWERFACVMEKKKLGKRRTKRICFSLF